MKETLPSDRKSETYYFSEYFRDPISWKCLDALNFIFQISRKNLSKRTILFPIPFLLNNLSMVFIKCYFF